MSPGTRCFGPALATVGSLAARWCSLCASLVSMIRKEVRKFRKQIRVVLEQYGNMLVHFCDTSLLLRVSLQDL